MTTNVLAELEGQALGLAESVVMGVAGTAPAFSIAATTATLIGAVGLLAPASLLYCGLIMFGVTFAYLHLNRLNPSAGAAYAWVGAIFNRTLGFFAGWALLVASVVFMVSGTIPAATATLTLVAPRLAAQPAAAAGWLLVVSAVIVKGIKLTSYSQIAMTVTETAILLALILLAMAKYGAHPAHAFSWVWLSPGSFTLQLFATGALTALFFFWGWDVTVNLTEETRDASRAPGPVTPETAGAPDLTGGMAPTGALAGAAGIEAVEAGAAAPEAGTAHAGAHGKPAAMHKVTHRRGWIAPVFITAMTPFEEGSVLPA
ncbi:hypothetical protein LMG10661_02922 [Ralstonia syzygii subsp. syzygii]|nr:hypothetical protein LMG10661_02922 [Ralstonia syzygii subsp. syzygii]